MARIDLIYNLITDILRKQRNGFISISTFNEFADFAQLEVFNDDFPRYATDQTVQDALDTFKVAYSFTSNGIGVVTFPDNYLHFLNARTVYGSTLYDVAMVNDDEWRNALNSQLRPVSMTYPIGNQGAKITTIAPQQTQHGTLTYLRRPVAPQYLYTENGRQIIYNPASVQFEWADNYINKIVIKMLSYFGVYLNETQLIQFAEMKDKETTA